MCDVLSNKNILSFSKNPDFFSLIVLETVNSTNSYAKEMAKTGHPHGTVVVADTQTNGRGRLGREFFSPKGTGIYMSIIIHPQKINLPANLLTVAAGVAVCRVVSGLSKARPKIKWVNDIFANGKKVCGILAEGLASPGKDNADSIILGIGINISTPPSVFPGKLNELAGSIFPENIGRNEIIAKLLDEIFLILESIKKEDLISEYKSYSLVLGKKIDFAQNGKVCSGIAADINIDGNLVVTLENGSELVLKSGEVSLGSGFFVKKD